MRKALLFLIIFVVLLLAPTGIRYLQFYQPGGGEREAPPMYEAAEIPAVPTPASTAFRDDPEPGQGVVLLDVAHANQFALDEINYLDNRLAARGFDLISFDGGDLASALRPVNAFVVIAPVDNFAPEEVRAVHNFVARGGRLLLVGDPTRFAIDVEEDMLLGVTVTLESNEIPLNALANTFDISFNGDYLYNTQENEGNFRNIVLRRSGFAEDALVDGLEQLAFYSTHSLQLGPASEALITADDNTWSSDTDRAGGLVLAASGGNGRVLALGDVHFLTTPYNTVYDNGQFVTRIADFLTATEDRQLALSDFPYFFGPAINLVYTGAPQLGPDAFDEVIALQRALRDVGKRLDLVTTPPEGTDTLYAGLYNEAEDVDELLQTAGVTLVIEPPIAEEQSAKETNEEADSQEAAADETAVPPTRIIQSPLGSVQMSGTALILLDESDGARRMVVLAASADGLESALRRLINLVPLDADATTTDCLTQANLALCPTNVANEPVEAVLETGGMPDTAVSEPDEEAEEDTDAPPADEDEATPELDAALQGSIGLGDTVEGTLEGAQGHGWTFSDGPVFIDITAEPAADLDIVLEVYAPDNELLRSIDREITGLPERVVGLEIPDDGRYTIVVRDFFERGGDYTLTVSEGEELPAKIISSIFIFADDNGEPLDSGTTSAAELAALLEDNYATTVWTSTDDGPLGEVALDAFDLVIWDSGDFRDEEGFLGEDAVAIFNYIEAGGSVLVIGSSPTLLGGPELAPLEDIEFTGTHPILLDGFEAGQVIELDQVYETALSDQPRDPTGLDITFLLRGPASEGAGNVIGLASSEPTLDNQRSALLLFPFTALPNDVQETLLFNLIRWFESSSE